MLWTTTSPVTSSLLMPWRRPCAYRETVKRMQAIMKATRLDVIALFLVDGWQYEWRCVHRQPPSRTGVSVITFEPHPGSRRGAKELPLGRRCGPGGDRPPALSAHEIDDPANH